MFDRIELKEKAKVSFRANYWKCVLIGVIMNVVGAGAGAGGGNIEVNLNNSDISFISMSDMTPIFAILGTVVIGAVVVSLVASIFLINPLRAGCLAFMRRNAEAPAELDVIGEGFKQYKKVVVTMFFADLYIFLWSLLLIIPGIVKSYSYRMVPYLVVDHPELSRQEILAMSEEMMRGNRWAAFVLDWSFFGWNLLSAFTLGLVGVFYAGPYQHQTNANLYLELSRTDRPTFEL